MSLAHIKSFGVARILELTRHLESVSQGVRGLHCRNNSLMTRKLDEGIDGLVIGDSHVVSAAARS